MNNLGNPQMHDKRKNIAPAYSFGVKHKNFTNNHSPGPKFNIEGNWFHFTIFIDRSTESLWTFTDSLREFTDSPRMKVIKLNHESFVDTSWKKRCSTLFALLKNTVSKSFQYTRPWNISQRKSHCGT